MPQSKMVAFTDLNTEKWLPNAKAFDFEFQRISYTFVYVRALK